MHEFLFVCFLGERERVRIINRKERKEEKEMEGSRVREREEGKGKRGGEGKYRRENWERR